MLPSPPARPRPSSWNRSGSPCGPANQPLGSVSEAIAARSSASTIRRTSPGGLPPTVTVSASSVCPRTSASGRRCGSPSLGSALSIIESGHVGGGDRAAVDRPHGQRQPEVLVHVPHVVGDQRGDALAGELLADVLERV